MRIVGPDRRILDAARRFRDRGADHDLGHGARASFSFEAAEALIAEGFRPHALSSTSTR